MKTPTKRKDPLAVLKDQNARQRRDVVRATKFVATNLSGEHLVKFVAEITEFLNKFAARMEGAESAQPNGGGE